MLFLDISDKELVERILILRNKERALTVNFLKYLGELDSRKLYLPAGYSSFFDYCVRKLGYSESGAFRRVECSRVLREFPELECFILKGELNLSVLASAARKLMEGRIKINHIIGKSCREVEGLIAGLNPLNKPREKIKQISVLVPKENLLPTLKVGIVVQKFTPGTKIEENAGCLLPTLEVGIVGREFAPELKVGENNDCLPPMLKVAASATNLNPTHSPEHRLETRVEIKFSLSQESFKKLEEVKAALSNKLGSGASVEEIFNELMNRYLNRARPRLEGSEKTTESEYRESKCHELICPESERLQLDPTKSEDLETQHKAKLSLSENLEINPTKASTVLNSKNIPTPKIITRHIPSAIRRAVLQRDDFSCSYIAADGTRCNCRSHLHIDHIKPFSLGGRHTVGNLRVLCSAHNLDRM